MKLVKHDYQIKTCQLLLANMKVSCDNSNVNICECLDANLWMPTTVFGQINSENSIWRLTRSELDLFQTFLQTNIAVNVVHETFTTFGHYQTPFTTI